MTVHIIDASPQALADFTLIHLVNFHIFGCEHSSWTDEVPKTFKHTIFHFKTGFCLLTISAGLPVRQCPHTTL